MTPINLREKECVQTNEMSPLSFQLVAFCPPHLFISFLHSQVAYQFYNIIIKQKFEQVFVHRMVHLRLHLISFSSKQLAPVYTIYLYFISYMQHLQPHLIFAL